MNLIIFVCGFTTAQVFLKWEGMSWSMQLSLLVSKATQYTDTCKHVPAINIPSGWGEYLHLSMKHSTASGGVKDSDKLLTEEFTAGKHSRNSSL